MNRFVLVGGCGLLIQSAALLAQNTPVAPAAAAPPVQGAPSLAHALNKAFGDVYEKVSPGVVVIEAAEPGQSYSRQGPFLLLMQDPDAQSSATNQGSGFLITPDGYILTNSHVLEGASPNGVTVTLKDGRKFKAKVAGIDDASDLAVLKISASKLPVVEFGDSDAARVGEFAFALGAPYDLRYTFTYGIISAKGRTDLTPTHRSTYEEYLQTDAAINPGNSGGPLVDIDGRVIGVNTLIYGLDQGLGFAIPINMAKKIASQLIADGRAIRSWLGISIRDLSQMPDLASQYPDFPKGIFVDNIVPGTPASQSALRPSDIIVSIDGKPVATPLELQKAVFDKQVGDQVELGVWRGSKVVKVKLRTAEHLDGVMPVVNQRMLPGMPDESGAPGSQPAPQASPGPGLDVRGVTADMAIAMKLQAEEGVLVTSVHPGSAAAAAGVKVGDVVTSVGGKAVRSREDFAKAISGATGEAVMLDINRGEEKTYAILKL